MKRDTERPDRWRARLSDYVDGEMPARTRRALEEHLLGCQACRSEVDELRRLVARAPELRTDSEPSTDLWPGIARRLAARPRAARIAWIAWPPRLLPRLAVAAILLVAASWTAVVVLNRLAGGTPGQPVSRTAVAPASQAVAPDRQAEPARGAEHARDAEPEPDPEYYRTVAALEREARARLHPDARLVGVLEENLATLDVAITNYRDAIAADPADERLRKRLSAARQQKLEVLRQAVTLTEGTN